MAPTFKLCLLFSIVLIFLAGAGFGKPVADEPIYRDTEEILNEWNNDDNYYSDELEDQSSEEHKDVQVPAPATIPHLPPVFIQHVRMTPTSTTKKPIYIPHTDIDLGTLSEQVHKARRNELEEPVDLPIPYIVWARDPSGRDDQMNYWKKFYNTVYKVD